VEIAAKIDSLDPDVAPATTDADAAKAQLEPLIYDVLEPNTKFRVNGAFHVTAFDVGKRVALAATEDYRLGRPFVDSIEITMGRAAHDRILDLELNKTDFAEIPAEDARRAAERGVRVSRSQPDELLALAFAGGLEPERGAPVNKRLREALALSIDRAAIVNFILQKEGEPAGGLLPQWSSGTAFLFSTAADPVQAKKLASQMVPAPKMVLGYDSGDSLEQAVAERIVVNAREAGVTVTPRAIRLPADKSDARIVRLRIQSKDAALALEDLANNLATMTKVSQAALPNSATPEQIYERERWIVSSYQVVPLVRIPRVYGLSARVRNWTPPGPCETWPLADVWLDGTVEAASEEKKK